MIQRIASEQQRERARNKAKVRELMSLAKWTNEQTISDHIDKNITTLARARALMKEMAAILIQIRKTL